MKRSDFLKSILFLPFVAKAAIEAEVLTPITLVDEVGLVPDRTILMNMAKRPSYAGIYKQLDENAFILKRRTHEELAESLRKSLQALI